MGIYDQAIAKSLLSKDSTEDFLENSDQVESALSIGLVGRDTVKARKAATEAKQQKSKAAKAETDKLEKSLGQLDTLAKSARDVEFRELVAEANALRELKGLAPLREAELLEKGLADAKRQLRRENEIVFELLKRQVGKRRLK